MAFATCSRAANETATVGMSVTGTLSSTISLRIDLNNGPASASVDSTIGIVSRTSQAPAGWSRVINQNSWSLTTSVGVVAQMFNSGGASQGYSLQARLQNPTAAGQTWSWSTAYGAGAGSALSTSESVISANWPYYTRRITSIVIQTSNTATGSLSNAIIFTAIAL